MTEYTIILERVKLTPVPTAGWTGAYGSYRGVSQSDGGMPFGGGGPAGGTGKGMQAEMSPQWTDSVTAEDLKSAWLIARQKYYLAGGDKEIQIVDIVTSGATRSQGLASGEPLVAAPKEETKKEDKRKKGDRTDSPDAPQS